MPITINGSGTVTGISAGGLPDGVITPADLAQPLTLGTAQASTSGTSIDFTGIPSWVKRVTVMLNGVSTSGTSNYLVQAGTSSGVTTSGYAGAASNHTGGTAVNFSSGFQIVLSPLAASVTEGILLLVNQNGNNWCQSATMGYSSTNALNYSAGSIALSGTLDRVRITTLNGTDTFDAGSINILYE